MNPEQNQLNPQKDHILHYNPSNPKSLVMLKNIKYMSYFHESRFHDDGTGRQVLKQFPNYYILNNLQVAHQQKAILHAMLKHNTDPEIMITQFCVLAKACYPNNKQDIDKLCQDFLNKRSTDSDILRWYTKESFFYQLLNRLLRAGKDSTELYYGQYFTKLLSQAIKAVYQIQKIQKTKQATQSIKCYRGGYFSQKQLQELQKNVGKHIQTLGFMSTTISKQVAYDFLQNGNTLVEIDINDVPKDAELDQGFAFLNGNYSEKTEQKQILFNVLSSFQIKNVSKLDYDGRKVWHIKLQYGVTYQKVKKYKQGKLDHKTVEIQQEQILQLLSWQDLFKGINCQEQCVLVENPTQKYFRMRSKRIFLSIKRPQFQDLETKTTNAFQNIDKSCLDDTDDTDSNDDRDKENKITINQKKYQKSELYKLKKIEEKVEACWKKQQKSFQRCCSILSNFKTQVLPQLIHKLPQNFEKGNMVAKIASQGPEETDISNQTSKGLQAPKRLISTKSSPENKSNSASEWSQKQFPIQKNQDIVKFR